MQRILLPEPTASRPAARLMCHQCDRPTARIGPTTSCKRLGTNHRAAGSKTRGICVLFDTTHIFAQGRKPHVSWYENSGGLSTNTSRSRRIGKVLRRNVINVLPKFCSVRCIFSELRIGIACFRLVTSSHPIDIHSGEWQHIEAGL